MRFLTLSLLLIALAFTSTFSQSSNPPEFKLSFDYSVIQTLQSSLIQPLLESETPKLQIANGTTMKEGPITITAGNISIPSFSIDWSNTYILTPNDNNLPSIQIRNLSATIQLDLDIKALLINYHGKKEQLIIEGMDLDIALGFDTLPDETTYAYLDSVSVNIQTVTQELNPKFNQFLVSFIEKFGSIFGFKLSDIVSNILVKTITGYNQTIIDKSTAGISPVILDFLQVQLSLADLPVVFKVNNDAYQAISFNLEIVNLNTNETAPVASYDELPNYLPNEGMIQLYISEDMISQLLWGIFQSGKVNLFFSNATKPAGFPVNLDTSDLVILFPGLDTEYGAENEVYLNIQKGGDYPIVFVRDGRIVIELALLLDMYVENDMTEYPAAALANCSHCTQALSLNLSAFVAVDAYSINSTHVGARVMDVALSQVELMSGNLGIGQLEVTLNNLLVPLLGQINSQLQEGFQIPLIDSIGVGVSLAVGTSYVVAGISLDNAQSNIYEALSNIMPLSLSKII